MDESASHMSEQNPIEPVPERRGIPRALRLTVLVVALVALLMGAGIVLAGRLTGSGRAIPDPAAFAPQQPALLAGSGALPLEGQPAPDFTLKTLDGSTITLSKLQGHPVLINFWASWCAPCRAEMPEIVQAYETHKADGLIVLAINMTFQDSLPEAQAFAKEFHMPFPVLLDDTGAVGRDAYGLRGLPMSFFVDRKGVIAHRQIGAMNGKQLDTFVSEILK
jgi:cytochrome c biogenesis protein CcmG/thiol:disulfide interchange protein DsbE